MSATTDSKPPGFANPKGTWDERFAKPGYLFGERPSMFIEREAAHIAPAAHVLCVADGEGRNSIWLAEQGFKVTAFDLSPVAMDKARRWAAERGQTVDFHEAGVDDWPWTPQAFDAVAAIFVQFADPDMRARMFAGMWNTLKPGGLLLVHGYTPKQLEYRTGGPGKVEHLYTADMMRSLLPDAEWVSLRDYEAELDEGSGHAGRSALLDAIARKPA